jgi:hypothetical protein
MRMTRKLERQINALMSSAAESLEAADFAKRKLMAPAGLRSWDAYVPEADKKGR